VKGFRVTVLTLMMFKFMYREVLIYFKPYEGQLKSLSIMMQCAKFVRSSATPRFHGFDERHKRGVIGGSGGHVAGNEDILPKYQLMDHADFLKFILFFVSFLQFL
jgi:hypothetical protein